MSTSLLVEKMKRAAAKQSVEAEIWAVNAENTDLKDVEANVIKLRIDSYQGIQTKCMPFLFSLDKSPKM